MASEGGLELVQNLGEIPAWSDAPRVDSDDGTRIDPPDGEGWVRWLAGAHAGDSFCFDRLLTATTQWRHRLARFYGQWFPGEEEIAEELVHFWFYRAVVTYDAQRGPFWVWYQTLLRRAVVRASRQWQRSRRPVTVFSDLEGDAETYGNDGDAIDEDAPAVVYRQQTVRYLSLIHI